MKCHYEVLDVPRDVNSEDLKKAYRKAALKWHPDKNIDNTENAKEQFQLVQQAYEVLNDSHERAWYDAHRDAILKGGLGGDYKDDSLDVFPYFSTTCFKGFSDDEGSFYSIYREVFNKIAAEDAEYLEDGDSDFEVPSFGSSTSDFKEVVQPFYAYWLDYTTKKSFSWLDQCDIRDLPNRRIAKLVEKENKKIRDRARKDRNEQIRNLVAFVRKRDKRVQAQAEVIKQQNAEKARQAEERRKSKVKERQQKLQDYQESEWSKFSNFENELKNIEKSLQAEYGDNDSSDNEDETEEKEISNENECDEGDFDALYCPACQKLFKTVKAFANHENSKKHKENVEILRQAMLEEEEEIEDAEEEEVGDEEEVEDEEKVEDEELEEEGMEDLEEEEEDDVGNDNKEEMESDEDEEKDKIPKRNADTEESNLDCEVHSDDSDSLNVLANAKSQKKKPKSNFGLQKKSLSSEELDSSDTEELVMLSKKQRRKLQQQRVPNSKPDKGIIETEPSVSEEANVETVCDEQNGLPKAKLKGKKAKEARKQKKQGDSLPNMNGTANDKIHSKKMNSKNIEVDISSMDVEHTCATCVSHFSSKNKLFEHLKKTGHSVFLPNKKGNAEGVRAIDDQKKGKGRRK